MKIICFCWSEVSQKYSRLLELWLYYRFWACSKCSIFASTQKLRCVRNFDFYWSHTSLLLAHHHKCGAVAHWLERQIPTDISSTSVMARQTPYHLSNHEWLCRGRITKTLFVILDRIKFTTELCWLASS